MIETIAMLALGAAALASETPAAIKIGDKVECRHDQEWQTRHLNSDIAKAEKLGKHHFMGNAAAYMHLDEAYVVIGFTKTGGLRLRGFAASVSANDVRLSDKPIYR